MVAVRVPPTVGVKVTVTVQDAPAASVAPAQVVVSAKSPGFVPVNVTVVTVTAAVPVFVSVATWAALDVPTIWLGYDRTGGVSDTVSPTPVPVRATV